MSESNNSAYSFTQVETREVPTTQQSQEPQMRPPKMVDTYASLDERIAQAQAKLASNETTNQPTISETASGSAEPKNKPEETVTLSPQLAALARKEQKFRQQEQALKDRETALEARNAKIAKLEALEAKLASKDYSGLDELGIDYNEYTNYKLNQSTEVNPEQEVIKKLASEVELLKKTREEDVTKQFDAVVEERRRAIKTLVDSNPEYSSIKELKMEEAVVQHILDTFEHDDVELSPEEAAKEVEELLLEKANQWTSLSKLKPKVEEAQKKQLPPLKPALKTLTNNMQATGEITKPNKPMHNMSDSERYAEAMRRVQEKQKI